MTNNAFSDQLGSGVLGVGIGFALYLLVSGLGFGGRGGGRGEAQVPPAVLPEPKRCTVRIAATGISVDGNPVTLATAVAACKGALEVDLVVTGGARQGDIDAMEAALRAAGISFKRREASAPGAEEGGMLDWVKRQWREHQPAKDAKASVSGNARGQYGRSWR